MNLHPPPVGFLTQPYEYNDHIINRLQEEIQPFLPFAMEEPKFIEVMPPRCDHCTKLLSFGDGFPFMDDFYCDACTAELAENGEFS